MLFLTSHNFYPQELHFFPTIFLTLAIALANLAFAAFNYFLRVANAFGDFAKINFFLSSATFFWALSWALRAFLALGDFADEIFALIFAILLASTLAVTLTTFLVAFLSATLALAIFALIAVFWAGVALLRAFFRATIFFAILSWAFKAAFLYGLLAAASFFLISTILDFSYLWNFALA